MSQQKVTLKAAGMYSFPNRLSSVPSGALLRALNIVISRDNIIESRRGFKLYGDAMTSTAHQHLTYKGRLLRHYGGGSGTILEFDSDGAGSFDAFSGTYAEVTQGLRIKGVEANGNFYFTTSDGIKKISSTSASTLASATIGNAGMFKGLDLRVRLNSTPGWFTQDSTVAYRIVWGKKDNNQNLILGTPSERVVIYNSITGLLITDFNSLLASLDTCTNSGGINDGNYVTTLKLSSSDTASTVRTRLISLVTKIDNDTIITEGAINTATHQRVSATQGIVSFSADITTFLQTSDVLNFTALGSAEMNNNHGTITKVAPAFSTTGNTTNTSATITNIPSTTGMIAGQPISGTGIPANTVIASVDSATQITISIVATATNAGTALTIKSIATFTPATNYASNDAVPIADATGVCQRLKYTLLAQPTAPTDGTTVELEDVQLYYDAIVSDLQNELSGICTGASFNSNNSTQSATTILNFTIPSGITATDFYQIYRTQLTTSTGPVNLFNLDPGEEFQQSGEDNPTAADISNGYVQITDTTPSDFLGANLYTNPNTGSGILQANEVPPLAKDVVSFKNYTFYANTQTKYRLNLSLLSLSELVSGQSTITITDGATSNTYTFISGAAEVTDFTAVADVANSLNGKYFTINSANDYNQYYVWFDTTGAGVDPAVAGKTGIKVSLTTGDVANTVATKIRAKLNQNINFTITGATSHIIITNVAEGIATDATNGTAGFTHSITTQGAGEDATNKKILLSDNASVAQAVDETSRSLERVINRNSDITYVYYLSGENDVPGLLLFEARNLGNDKFYFTTDSSATSSQFSPNTYQPSAISGISVANPTVVTSTAHGLTTGNQIIISGSNSTPSIDGVRTVTVINANTFSVAVNVTILGNLGGWILVSQANAADNEVNANRIYYSKVSQPDAVPIVNYLDIGPKDKQIFRAIALRDNLFILKEEGVYRLSGAVSPFTVSLFDSSTNIAAPDSAVVLNNLIYCFTTQGVTRISDTGVEIISRPIEDLLLKLTIPSYTNFMTATVGASYESDRTYYLWTVTDPTDVLATQCFRYNTFTNCWVESDKGARSAIVNPFDDRLYTGAVDVNFTEQERKSFDRTDYADREVTNDVSVVSGTTVTLGSVANMSIGDVATQVQYLTIKKFNQLLTKLDNDIYLADSNYFSTLGAVAGANLATSVDNVINKIAADAGRLAIAGHTIAGTYTALTPTPTDFAGMQTTFNSLITLLNTDPGVGAHNYLTSDGTVLQEINITAISSSNDTITTQFAYPFIIGPLTVYNHINCRAEYLPEFFQDVSMSKHVSESTVIFEDASYSSATISYATDLNPSYYAIPFQGNGNGIFGNGFYGAGIYGGNGSGIPFRTYVPREKQRCRYMNIKFEHAISREIFSLYGISLTYLPISQRAYR